MRGIARGHHACAGPSAVVKVTGIAEFTTEPLDDNPAALDHPQYGRYGTRVSSGTVDIKCHDCVAPEAIQRANEAVTNMLAGCPAPLLRRMRDQKAGLAIIGVGQCTGDIPEFRFHKWDTGAPCGGPRMHSMHRIGPAAMLSLTLKPPKTA